MRKAKITAVGCYTPPNLLTNDDLSKMVDTNDQWILERTGIQGRGVLPPPEMATSDMAVEAAKVTLDECGREPRRDRLHSALHRHSGHDVSIDGVALFNIASDALAPGDTI